MELPIYITHRDVLAVAEAEGVTLELSEIRQIQHSLKADLTAQVVPGIRRRIKALQLQKAEQQEMFGEIA